MKIKSFNRKPQDLYDLHGQMPKQPGICWVPELGGGIGGNHSVHRGSNLSHPGGSAPQMKKSIRMRIKGLLKPRTPSKPGGVNHEQDMQAPGLLFSNIYLT